MAQIEYKTKITDFLEESGKLDRIVGSFVAGTDTVQLRIRSRGMWRFKVSEVDAWVRASRKGGQS